MIGQLNFQQSHAVCGRVLSRVIDPGPVHSYRPGPSAKKEVVHVSSVASRFELARAETHASEWGEWFLADDFRRRFIISSSLNQQVLHQAENVLQLFNLGIVLTRFACSRDLTWSLIQSILCFRFVSDQQVLHQAENVLQLFNSGIVLTRFACSRDLNWSQIQSILCFRFVSDWRLFPIIA